MVDGVGRLAGFFALLMEKPMARQADPKVRMWWRELLDCFDPERQTVAEFCLAQGISAASFYKWRKRLQADRVPAIVPVEIVDRRDAREPEHCAVIQIGDHAEVRIDAHYPQLATQIVVALASAQPASDEQQEA